MAIQLSHKLNNELDSHTAVADIFKYKTIQEFSNYLADFEIEEFEEGEL